MDVNEEKEHVQQAIRGDTQALAVLLQEHYAFVLKYLIKSTMNPVLAEDLTQETIIRCIEKIQTFNGRSKFSSWMIAIATHLHMDDLRRKKREQRLWEQEQGLRKIHWRASDMTDDWMQAIDALSRLSPKVRVPVILKHYYGYSYEEIARMMRIAEGTAKSRVHNGLKRLRKELQENETE